MQKPERRKAPEPQPADDAIEIDGKLWRQRLSINLNNLHREAAEHATYYAEIAEDGAVLKARMQVARSQYDLVKAEVDAEVRVNPEKFSLMKITESAIQAIIVMDRRVRIAEKGMLRAQRDYGLVAVLVDAFEHRRSMLNNEVQLYVANYWALGEAISVGSSEERAKLRQDRTEGVKNVRRRRQEG